MAYLRNFTHDIFVSYAHGPKGLQGFNGERRDILSCWTQAFTDALASQLDVILGTKEDERRVKIWMDPALDGNQPLSDSLKTEIGGSALLLVVMSHFYLKSHWCGEELDWFAAKANAGDGRIFVVRAYNTDEAHWPPALKPGGNALKGYPFYLAKDAESLGDPLGWPVPDTSDKAFWKQVTQLADEIARQLKRLEYLQDKAPTQTLDAVPEGVGCTVFLGYMHDSLQDVREKLRQRLVEAHLNVVPPAAEDPIDEPSLRASFDKYSAQASALVLVANEGCELWPRRQVGGPINFQLQLAQERKLPVHLWLDIDDLSSVKNTPYRQFLTALKVRSDHDPSQVVTWDGIDGFADYVRSKLDSAERRDPGIEQFAIVCSNIKSVACAANGSFPQYEDFQDLVLDSIAGTERGSILADADNAGLIRLADLEEQIARADTLVVLCFDQDWLWANRIIQQLKQVVGGRCDKIKILVTGPQYKNRGTYYNAFRFQTVTGVGPDNVIQKNAVQDQIRKAFQPRAA